MNMILTRVKDEILLSYSKLRARPSATKRNIASLENWFYNNDGAINKTEQAFIGKPDLISAAETKTPLARRFFEDYMLFPSKLFRKKQAHGDSATLREVDRRTRAYVNDTAVDRVAAAAMLVSGITMLIAPIWLLGLVGGDDIKVKLGIITGFIVLFMGLVLYATTAKPVETLAGTAA